MRSRAMKGTPFLIKLLKEKEADAKRLARYNKIKGSVRMNREELKNYIKIK